MLKERVVRQVLNDLWASFDRQFGEDNGCGLSVPLFPLFSFPKDFVERNRITERCLLDDLHQGDPVIVLHFGELRQLLPVAKLGSDSDFVQVSFHCWGGSSSEDKVIPVVKFDGVGVV